MNYRGELMKKIIIPTGYMGSGSSAITDLLREYPVINTKNADFEYIFLHAPNGVFDLENKLLKNNNDIRSDEALKTFENFMISLYEYRGWWPAGYRQRVSKNIDNIVDEYINNLTTSKFSGAWYYHEKVSVTVWLLEAVKNRVYRILKKRTKKIKPKQQQLAFSLISPNEFYKYSNQFINNIIDEFSKNDEYVVLDQLLLPHNLQTIESYKMDNLYPIIVSRDPRDVFISNKYYWYPDNYQVPYPLDPYEFCKYYKAIRNSEPHSDNRVLRINFEDLILNYEQSVFLIEDYLQLPSNFHKEKLKYLNPELSINNIQIYNRNDKYKEEVKIIEQELSEYLYPFKNKIVSDGDIF